MIVSIQHQSLVSCIKLRQRRTNEDVYSDHTLFYNLMQLQPLRPRMGRPTSIWQHLSRRATGTLRTWLYSSTAAYRNGIIARVREVSRAGPCKTQQRLLVIQLDDYTHMHVYCIPLLFTSQYLWKFHSLLFASSPLLYLASLLLPPPPPSHTPLEEACSATQNTLINMKEATN